MGRDGLARKRSQAVHVEGLSHAALLKVKLLWGFGLKTCLNSGLSLDQFVVFV